VAILDFWVNEIGNLGLGEIDDANFAPPALAFHGLFDPIIPNAGEWSLRKPEYFAVREAASVDDVPARFTKTKQPYGLSKRQLNSLTLLIYYH
jgi:hypothetical protein